MKNIGILNGIVMFKIFKKYRYEFLAILIVLGYFIYAIWYIIKTKN